MIRVEDLVFDYPGFRALDGVSFAVEPHSITALVGLFYFSRRDV